MADAQMGVVLPGDLFYALVSCLRVHNQASGNGTHTELLAAVDAFIAAHPAFPIEHIEAAEAAGEAAPAAAQEEVHS